MRVLIVKTSSMGDLIHTLPAVTDAARANEGIRFDWVAEHWFAEIPGWHPAVEHVIPVSIRKWRRNPLARVARKEIASTLTALRAQHYDYVIDAQGLIKSAILTRLCRGRRCGLNSASCREPLAAAAYQDRFAVAKEMHAIDRVRMLFSRVLDYDYDSQCLDYGLDKSTFDPPAKNRPYVVFLHGTSWRTKLWPSASWRDLAGLASAAGYDILLPWGGEAEKVRAEEIAGNCGRAEVLPRMPLTALAGLLAYASGVVGVDTGLAHLAAALGVPGVTLYLNTYPRLTGARGALQTCLARPEVLGGNGSAAAEVCAGLEAVFCEHLSAETVWGNLTKKMNPRGLKDSIINGLYGDRKRE
ncbi:MAG: lipopolysaccharide heptosyltransferase I [Pseudomonadota bacterium]